MLNSTSQVYSVVAFLLVMGCTLMALPLSVFSQSAAPDAAGTTETQTTLELDADPVIDGDATTTISAPLTAVIGDSYVREQLPNGDVFSDFVVGPGRFEVELAPGQSKTVEMIISNRMGVEKTFSIGTEDAEGTTDGSQALVLLGDDRGPYTIKDNISVPHEQFVLKHSERERVPVTISLPADAEPGGRYGSLLVSIVSDPNQLNAAGGAAPASVIVSRIGTLFFISTPGFTDQSGQVQDFSTAGDRSVYAEGPISFGVVYENTGDVHVNPYGEINITNMFGDEVGFVKLEPWFVLPRSLRLREVSWDRELLIGRYTATAKINRGYGDIIDESTLTFWVLPWKLLSAVFVGLFIIFAALRFVITRFEFKRKS